MKRTYSDNTVGKGAWYEWAGNDKVGSGRQEILESVRNARVVDDLHFKTPFESRSKATFAVKPLDDKTEVTWSIDGGDGFSTKMMNVFMSMDDAVGADFENGLRFLNEVASQQASTTSPSAPATDDAVSGDAGLAED
jgi:hypothetical protein